MYEWESENQSYWPRDENTAACGPVEPNACFPLSEPEGPGPFSPGQSLGELGRGLSTEAPLRVQGDDASTATQSSRPENAFRSSSASSGDPLQDATGNLGNALAPVGALDEGLQAHGMFRAPNAAPTRGVPGAGALGHLGGILSVFGLANDIDDISENGLDAENGISAATNTLGAGSWTASMLGSAAASNGALGIAAASSAATGVLAAGAGGLAIGTMGNNAMSKWGLLGGSGEYDEQGNERGRSWSDWGGDLAGEAYEAAGGGVLGQMAGTSVSLGTSVIGAAGALATAPLALGQTIADVGGNVIDWFASDDDGQRQSE